MPIGRDWLDYPKTKSAYLNDRLAHADSRTGSQLLELVNELKAIAAQMQQYENAAKVARAACTGRVSTESDGLVEISWGQTASWWLPVDRFGQCTSQALPE